MKERCERIQLSSGKYAIVDSCDYEILSQYTWSFSKGRHTDYAITWKGKKYMRMHQMIMKPNRGLVVDHINGDGLDNRRDNLRVCTTAENSRNRNLKSTNKSGVTGVFWCKGVKKWTAQITVNYKAKHLGYFKEISDAIKSRKDAESIYFGEFAKV